MKALVFACVCVLLLLGCPCSCRRPIAWLFGEDVDYASEFAAQALDDDFDFGTFDYATAATASASSTTSETGKCLNVVDYGAVGNGQADDTEAFKKAWADLCSASEGVPTLRIPAGKSFVLNHLTFQGPCRAASVHLRLEGTLMAPKSTNWIEMGAWILFSKITNLIIDGSGTINGQGVVWWNAFPKGGHHSDVTSPTGLGFHGCDGLTLSGLNHLNSPRNHISIDGCNDVILSKLKIIAPSNSPNTDGIDISSSTNIQIQDSFIGTGDDCIAINGGSSKINITRIICGPGHGISVGSLGRDGSYDTVEEVNVVNCTLRGTTNGVRIKTWQGGQGYAKKILFEHIILEDVENPIIIDQNYVDKSHNGNVKAEEIQVSDVTYSDIRGSSATEVAITVKCNREVGCDNIMMNDINLCSAIQGKNVTTVCSNANVIVRDANPPISCIPG